MRDQIATKSISSLIFTKYDPALHIQDSNGYSNVKLARNGMEAVISFENKNVELIKPKVKTPFNDFIELERWLAKAELEPALDEESQYYEAINDFITSHGFYEQLLVLQGSDKEYCAASLKMHKAGYLSGEPAKVIGALTMDSIKQHEQNRLLAISFLQSLEKRYSNPKETMS